MDTSSSRRGLSRAQAAAAKFAVVAALVGGSALALAGRSGSPLAQAAPEAPGSGTSSAPGKDVGRVVKSEAEWKKILTAEQFAVLRQEGTEPAFSGDYHPKKEDGFWRCAGCGLELFRASKQFDSGTGWPSFWQPIVGHVVQRTDADGERSEILCARCGGHLGHVFDDGPKPTGLRYCMNSVAMKFAPAKAQKAKPGAKAPKK